MRSAFGQTLIYAVRGIELGGPPDRIVLDSRERLFVAMSAQARRVLGL